MKVSWTKQAEAHLDGIYEYIARDSPFYTQRTVDKLTSRSELIADLPKLGRVVPEFGREHVRELIVPGQKFKKGVLEMSVSMPLDMDQLKFLIRQCKLEEKLELIHLLEKETFAVRFRQFMDKIKTDDLTMDEITAEVETVRQRRYDERKSD